jgi:uncharacterized OsmC-like protein
MSTQTTAATPTHLVPAHHVNGVNVAQVTQVIESIQADASFGQFQFRAHNQWHGGALNRSEFQDYSGANTELSHAQPFHFDNDEPPLLDGGDQAPNPVEYLLHALAGCLTTTLVYHAAVRGIEIASCESKLEGDIDLRGLFGISDEVRKGFSTVHVTMQVKSDADVATLKELAGFSPVYEMVSNSVPVVLTINKV